MTEPRDEESRPHDDGHVAATLLEGTSDHGDGIELSSENRAELAERARARLSIAHEQLAFLEKSTAAMMEMLLTGRDVPTTLVRLAIPYLADWCFLDLVIEGDRFERAAVAHRDPAKHDLVEDLKHFAPARGDPSLTMEVFETGKPALLRDVTDASYEQRMKSAEHTRLAKELGTRSSMMVPLLARGRVIGVLGLVRSRRTATDDDLALAQDFGNRCALALDNARLYVESQLATVARDNFLAIAAHDIRSPMTAVKLQTIIMGRLMERLQDAGTEALKNAHGKLARNVCRLEGLFTNLFDVARAAGGKLQVAPEETDLVERVRDVVERLELEAVGHGCRMSVSTPDAVDGRWDPIRIEQLIENLLSNAIKYGPNRPVEVTLSAREDTVELCIRDHGPGIPPEQQDRIFERFTRLEEERVAGLGLGLWIARLIARAHGGELTVASTVGDGATFFVRLPRDAGQATVVLQADDSP